MFQDYPKPNFKFYCVIPSFMLDEFGQLKINFLLILRHFSLKKAKLIKNYDFPSRIISTCKSIEEISSGAEEFENKA